MNRLTRIFVIFSIAFILILSLVSCGEEEMTARFVVDGEEYAVCSAKSISEFKLPNDPVKEGYTFAGWYLGEGEGSINFTVDALTSGETVTVYAKWTEIHVHTESEEKIFKEPTCFDDGIVFTECTTCGYKMSTGFIDSLDHVPSDWQIDVPSTCTVNGTRHKSCTLCETVIETGDAPLALHTEGSEFISVDPTCVDPGEAAVKCTECDAVLSSRVLSATGHTNGDERVSVPPTCTLTGIAVIECTECEVTVSERVLSALEHIERTIERVEPTETRDGLTEGVDCSRCNAVLTQPERIPAEISDCEIVISDLTLDGTTFTKTLSSSEETLSLVGRIKINEAASFILSLDSDGTEKTDDLILPINKGENTYYITVTFGESSVVYKLSIYRKNSFTVTFETLGGKVDPITVDEGEVIPSIPTSSLSGYDFAGWDIDLSAPITENKTANAIFTPRSDTPYTVIYYTLVGEDYVEKHRESCLGTTDTLAVIPEYTLQHYALNSEKSSAPEFIKGSGDLTLLIYLDPVKYTVRFDTGHSVTMPNESITALEPYTPTQPPERTGYRFDGWRYNGAVWSGTDSVTSDIYLIATWVRIVTVTFDTSNVPGLDIEPVTCDVGSILQLDVDLPVTEDQSVGFFLNDYPWILGYNVVTGDINLVAKWVDRYVTVTFETKGTNVPDPMTVEYGSVIESVPTPIRGSTYSFEGWYIKGSDIRWTPGTTPVTTDVVLEARWSIMTPPDVWS